MLGPWRLLLTPRKPYPRYTMASTDMTCDDISRSFQGHVTFSSYYRERQIACMMPTDMAYYVVNVASRLNDFM